MSFASVRRSFAARIFVVYVLMLLVVAGVLGAFSVWFWSRRLEAELLERGTSTAEILATGARTAVYSENGTLVRDVLAGVVEKREVLVAAVYALDGARLAVDGDEAALEGTVPRPAADRLAEGDEAPGTHECTVSRAPRTLDISCPVTLRRSDPEALELFFGSAEAGASRDVIGFVRLLLDREVALAELGGVVLRGLLLSLLLLAGGAVVVLMLARRITGPLVRLTEQVHELGAAGEAREIDVRRADEIGRLAAAFNEMLRSLAERARAQERLEERLRTARKMEAVGTFSRGIAHDFNNILSTVGTAVHVLERGNPDIPLVGEYARRIRVSLGHARELIDRLMAFSRAKLPELRPVDLVETVRGISPVLREAAGEGTEVVLELPSAPVRVRADAEGIRQALLNLCYNARDAMPSGGRLVIGVSAASGAEAAFARISVRDSGAGMEGEVRERIFEPFYSTKEAGRGTGLGLAIVHGIVEEHRGTISVASAPGEGTTFTIELPLDAGAGES